MMRGHVSETLVMPLKVTGHPATCLSVLRMPLYWIWSTTGSNMSSYTNLYFWHEGGKFVRILGCCLDTREIFNHLSVFLLHVNSILQSTRVTSITEVMWYIMGSHVVSEPHPWRSGQEKWKFWISLCNKNWLFFFGSWNFIHEAQVTKVNKAVFTVRWFVFVCAWCRVCP